MMKGLCLCGCGCGSSMPALTTRGKPRKYLQGHLNKLTHRPSPRFEDLTGKTFGNLKVLSRKGKEYKPTLWNCLCVCGTSCVKSGQRLRGGEYPSCGCKLRLRPYEALYNCFVSQSGRVHDISLSYEDFLVFTKEKFCLYCQSPITWAEFNPQKFGQNYNLDRVDNSKGYSNDNCIVCCTSCNMRRGDRFTHSQFLEIGDLLRRWRRIGIE
jgi:hypothetical protein